jgi:hypothetical protein
MDHKEILSEFFGFFCGQSICRQGFSPWMARIRILNTKVAKDAEGKRLLENDAAFAAQFFLATD